VLDKPQEQTATNVVAQLDQSERQSRCQHGPLISRTESCGDAQRIEQVANPLEGNMLEHHQCQILRRRLVEPRCFIPVLSGPRQTGRTTLPNQVVDSIDLPTHSATADQPTLKGLDSLEQQREAG
jgi:hypothetical protein